ncbi:sensor histidine kinase [Magnetospirillum molischianum]|uniref:histidine kinase n=1 Tax=Magnetospirillum molischianum DSM 120 TaxID=1150626 RepID=H8FVL3_MAGML|nr:sensor histidine kinase KdpD [Magnetospirillum molischianum]CCG42401.1 Sensory histidine kinase in two-component regulatory system with KdpE, regulation of potassium translocation (classical system) [Magnetospirillum molischianum DSM 120]
MTDDRDNRPSPEALLAEAQREGRGRLKIFLGAAPGVGKTYAMLQAAHERVREGLDVVAGVVETHRRRETEALVEGIELLPQRQVEYRGRSFREMDIDALLRRRPKIALIDELAHTNIPGSRHVKRWQDIDELLAAGIDVYSTLNIQHLESINDVVEQISGVKVRETLPDSVLATADEIEVIDLSPQDLIKRMEEGKVYVPEQARRAMRSFFTPGTLTALRELALRHAAERVDRQMVDYMRAHAISGPWPARERILVCFDEKVDAERLVRAAKRAAERRGAAWVAVTVETAVAHIVTEAEKDRMAAAMRLATQLGGETATLQGDDVADTVLTYARERNCTQIVVGRARRSGRFGRWGKSVTDRLIERAGEFTVILVGRDDDEKPRPPSAPPVPTQSGWRTGLGYGFALIATAIATGLGFLIDLWLPIANISVAYLLAVMIVAMRSGLRPGIVASIASFFCFNFFFTEPRLTFAITDSKNILTVVFFLIAAVIISNMAARLRMQIETTRENARRTTNLYDFGRKITAAATQDDVLWAVVHHVAVTIHGKSLTLLPGAVGLAIAAGYPPEDQIDDKSAAAADWAWSHGKPAGRGSTTLPTAEWLFLPLKTARGPIGVLGVQMIEGADTPSPAQLRLLETLADQAAVAIERTTLVADIEEAKVATERERLRSALLSSLSHDLRTPLVSIMGAASTLISYDDSLDSNSRLDLAQTIQDEAERLNRFVQNLLDMTRLGSGALKPKVDWVDLHDIVDAAVKRTRRLARHHTIRVDIDSKMPLLCLDAVLIEQVFFNLLDNACKYAPPGTTIKVWAVRATDHIAIEVADQGPGIPPGDREKVFDMFYRVQAADSQTAGTGLGLAICRGIIEAHGGTIKAEPGLHGAGTCIIIHLPLPPDLDLTAKEGAA